MGRKLLQLGEHAIEGWNGQCSSALIAHQIILSFGEIRPLVNSYAPQYGAKKYSGQPATLVIAYQPSALSWATIVHIYCLLRRKPLAMRNYFLYVIRCTRCRKQNKQLFKN